MNTIDPKSDQLAIDALYYIVALRLLRAQQLP
jgi:hypothetical protein